jgi:diguanylate cyclase (GGDEF)-like protein
MMIDLDHFKLVNDGFGHAVGDRVLIWAATSISDSLKRTDSAFRVGGDEFVVLLPGANRSRVNEVAAGIRTRFADRIRAEMPEAELPVGVSIGTTRIQHSGDTPTEALRRADEALYAAKHKRPDHPRAHSIGVRRATTA